MQNGTEPRSITNVVAFASRRERPGAERAAQVARQAAAWQALAKRRESFDRYALAGQELVTDLRSGCDPAVAVAAFQRKVDQG